MLKVDKMTTTKVKLSTDQFIHSLDELRDRKLLCDIHLVAEDESFPAHRVVLAAASPYFQAMFTGGFKENQMNEIKLNGMSSQGLKCVLDAIYTAELLLSDENVRDVLPVASLLQLNEIVEHCGRFLTKNVSAQNCLSFLSVAEKYDLQEVVDQCNKFVLENFEAISELMDFKKLSTEQLCNYLSDDQLKVHNGEIEVFRATLKWYEGKQSVNRAGVESPDLANLMQHVRFPLIPGGLLLDEILTCPLISGNPQVMKMVTEAMRFHNNDNIFLQPLQEGKQFQPRGEKILALISGTTTGSGESLTIGETRLYMISETDGKPFHNLVSKQSLPMNLHHHSLSLLQKGNYLFLFGTEAQYCRPIAGRFDVKTNTWLDLKPPPYKASIGMAATLLESNIYLLGGMCITNQSQKFPPLIIPSDLVTYFSQYSIETNSWSKLENLPKPLVYHSASSHGNYVFCAGGYSVNSNQTDQLYAFDVVGGIWLTKAAMKKRRVDFSLEVVGAKLAACGGQFSPNVEIYDIADDQWTLIQNCNLDNLMYAATVVLNDLVYVIGSAARDENGAGVETDYVSCIDVDNATIHRVSNIPLKVSVHSCAMLIASVSDLSK